MPTGAAIAKRRTTLIVVDAPSTPAEVFSFNTTGCPGTGSFDMP
jgi:hypothetical protein